MESGTSSESKAEGRAKMKTLTDILGREDLESMLRPLDEATPPPAAYYTSQDLYDLEIRNIFHKEWLWVGHSQDVRNPGDYFTFTYANEPVLVTRDQAGELHAFSNVCRHRGAIVAAGQGTCRSFACPYHKWTYGLNGKLLGAPTMNEVKGFDPSQYGLTPLKVESWEGNIMVNFDPACKPLAASLGDMGKYFQNFNMADLIITERREYHIPCNWKMLVENNMEAYHFLGTHEAPGEYCKLEHWRTIDGGRYNILAGEFDEPLTMNIAGSGGLAAASIPGLTDAELKRGYFISLYPSNFWAFQPDSVLCAHMIPEGVGRTKWVADFLFPKTIVERPDFEDIAKAAYDGVEGFVVQDNDVCDKAYRGYQSQTFRPGRLSLHERNMHRFAQYVLARVSNQEFPPAAEESAAAGR
jgi:phenylpropionate dioxygenase-like ring-hydroxylating dioxygenase large terminal subunit